ncbi:cation:proton antiporter regulatory subunit, partial [Halopiger djelfimassiliensis]|uniref:cation:proton antiporter regulatory subunit n=1 Tax=Halopiger djelfimassiliensis TaxID=1293047 RepID=UPI0018A800C5
LSVAQNEFAGWVSGTALAIDREDAEIAVPADNETLQAGDTLSVFGTPAQLQRLEEEPEASTP